MDVRCRIELFGEMRVVQEGRAHTRFRTHKAALLLAYLALHIQQAHTRERLVELFWPDMESKAGRDNLSTALSQLRRQLEPGGVAARSILVADWQQVRLNPEAVSVDVADFDRLIRQARRSEDMAERVTLLTQAVDLCKGDLLPACYEEWALWEQQRCRGDYQESLLYLADWLEKAGQFAEALTNAQRAAAADPYAEISYQAQMRLLARMGQPAAALQVYETLETRLQRDLGAPPSPATRQMAHALRRDPRSLLLKQTAAAPAHAPGRHAQATPFQASTHQASTQANTAEKGAPRPFSPPFSLSSAPSLPLQLTRFFGRVQEREQVARLLQTPGTRLVSILGPGGVGKTRLAVEAAALAAPAFADRVWFVSLSEIPDAGLIPSALVHALHLPPDPSCDALDCVTAFLSHAPSLLVLDNMEHLLYELPAAGKNDNPEQSGCAAWIQILLQRIPGLVCLATSRQALRLGGEAAYSLSPLALPFSRDDDSPERLLQFESVALYVDRARAARADFALTAHNAPFVAALCRRLEGLPLAIEMAAAWVKTLPPHKILERLGSQLDLLVSRRRDMPPRHQSLRAAIEWSYNLLPPELRGAFARLSVFQGGWTLEAAEAVCGARVLHTLGALQEHSLIAVSEDQDQPRYRLLEPLREFAGERLAGAGEYEIVHFFHARYFADFVRQAETRSVAQAQWYYQIEADIANIRAAFDWFLRHAASAQPCLEMAIFLQPFWHVRGYYHEGRERFAAALARPGADAPTTQRAHALYGAALLAARQADYDAAIPPYLESLEIGRARGDTRGVGQCLVGLGSVALMRRRLGEAQEYFQQAMTLYRRLDDKTGLSDALNNLGNLASECGDLNESQLYYEESLALRRQLDDAHRVANALSNLGSLIYRRGDYPQAALYLTECLLLCGVGGNRRDSIYGLRGFADLAAARSEWKRAIRLYGAVETLREGLGAHRSPAGEGAHQERMTVLRSQAGDAFFASNWAAGRDLSWEQAVRYALDKADANP